MHLDDCKKCARICYFADLSEQAGGIKLSL